MSGSDSESSSRRWPRALDLSDPRIQRRNHVPLPGEGNCVVYWMQRTQRAVDNPALAAAAAAANEMDKPLYVFFSLIPRFPHANQRHFAFMLAGLVETAVALERKGAAFVMRLPPQNDPATFCREVKALLCVSDENPLRGPESWRQRLARRLRIPLLTVDADVVVPTCLFPKEEYAARTIRPKIHQHLPRFLIKEREKSIRRRVPRTRRPEGEQVRPEELLRRLRLSREAKSVSGFRPGTRGGLRLLGDFLRRGLKHYASRSNHPEFPRARSHLSPYLHFGQLGPRQVALAVSAALVRRETKEAFLEELIVRRELAVNYVARNPAYDRYEGLPAWARASLEKHLHDKRPHLYGERELEEAETHDPLWNAAQMEMMRTGYMHGYVRMYWAKKILEWTGDPREALETAILLNDRYLLDGRDPNGYANIAWAIGGRHDRPWPEREIFGKVRFMSYASTSRKFDAAAYIRRVEKIEK